MAHTKGPWTIPEPWSGFSKIVGPNGELIFGLAAGAADEKRDDDECEANARLIAAAPDLLLAVKCLCEEMADYMAINKLGDPLAKHNYRLGMAAIAKAEKP